jgi:hypothetical protein
MNGDFRHRVARLTSLSSETASHGELVLERLYLSEVAQPFLPPDRDPIALAPVPEGRIFAYEQIKAAIDGWIGALLAAIPQPARAAFLDELSTLETANGGGPNAKRTT